MLKHATIILSSKIIETWPNTVSITNLMSYFAFPSSFDVKITIYCIKSLLFLFLQNWVGRTICNFIYLFVFLGNCKKHFQYPWRKSLKIFCVVIAKLYTTQKSIRVSDKGFPYHVDNKDIWYLYLLSLHNLLSEIWLFILNGLIKTCSQ